MFQVFQRGNGGKGGGGGGVAVCKLSNQCRATKFKRQIIKVFLRREVYFIQNVFE